MIWLEYLESINTYFNIEILQPNDSIIKTKILNDNQVIIILDGFIKILKVFTNGEVICTQLLQKDHIIKLKNSKNSFVNYYYTATAITKTVILTTNITELKKKNIKIGKFSYYNFSKNNSMIQILCHKNTKKRIAQLLLILSKEFGKIQKHNIIIPFYISHNTLSQIIGSQRVNVTRIMNELKEKRIINYNNQQVTIYNVLKLSQY
uniref:Global nitrogen transcriptional regulator n=1 Tax=Synarthrophyton chejuense TaxID=2485825 RepID=A0A3G3MFS5_9FLOR|nr:global nitrogen transcriptional regulator [Synarthrophyton chejuense]AYR05684.1 global nitrogen transcriptional regulator [Synarthrophyton chejuense]